MKYDCDESVKRIEVARSLGCRTSNTPKHENVRFGVDLSISVTLRRAVTPKRIKRRDTATIVEWMDGTQTKIVRPADVEDAELYTVFCIALAKKLYGSNSALKKAIHFADEGRQLAAEQEIAEMKKQAHEERMRKQLDRSTKRIARLARRAFKRDVIAQLATENIQVETESEENEPC